MMLRLLVLGGLFLACAAVNAQSSIRCGPHSGMVGKTDRPCAESGQLAGIDPSPFGAVVPPAGWIKVVVSENGVLAYYANPATARKAGDLVQMWDLLDARDAMAIGKQRYRSMNVQREYDCARERVRVLFVSAHSGNMGAGDLIQSEDSVRPWIPNSALSVGRGLWDVACGRSRES